MVNKAQFLLQPSILFYGRENKNGRRIDDSLEEKP
jgi:hypothetical protein